MKAITAAIAEYYRWLDKRFLLASAGILAVIVFSNYRFGIAEKLHHAPFFYKFAAYNLLFVCVFAGSWLAFLYNSKTVSRENIPATDFRFYLLLAFTPAVFAIKMALPVGDIVHNLPIPSSLHQFLEIILQWPVKLMVVFILVSLLWKFAGGKKLPAGLNTFRLRELRPYLLLLLLMLPLILLAASGHDFQLAYPKLALIHTQNGERLGFWRTLIFELAYGTDFFTIEFFFRGFVVLCFARYAGRAAILPMALFYCTIHFGKPLAECISSFFGGLILGAIVFNTRSIWGGLVVHLGIAWAMEIAGMIL